MNHVKHFLNGFVSLLDAWSSPRDYQPTSGFAADAQKIRSDIRRVGADLNRETEDIYGKQYKTNSRPTR